MPGRQAEGLVPPVLEVRQAAADWQSVWCWKHHTWTHVALLALPTATSLTFGIGGGTLLRSASRCCWRLLLRLLRRLLLLRLRRLLLRLRLLLLPLPLLLLPLDVKATGTAAGTVTLAFASTAATTPRVRSHSCDVLLQKVLLLGHLHGCLGLMFSHEALLHPARIDGQADDLLLELTPRSGNVLAKIFQ